MNGYCDHPSHASYREAVDAFPGVLLKAANALTAAAVTTDPNEVGRLRLAAEDARFAISEALGEVEAASRRVDRHLIECPALGTK